MFFLHLTHSIGIDITLHVTADPVIYHFTGPKMYQDTYGWRDLATARRAIYLITYTDHSH